MRRKFENCPNQKIGTSKNIFAILVVFVFFYTVINFFCDYQILCIIAFFLIIESVVQIGIWLIENIDEEKSKKCDWKHPLHDFSNENCQKTLKIPKCVKNLFFMLKTRLLEFLFFYHSFITFNNIREGWNFAFEHREYNSDHKHDAIIVNIYSNIGREYGFQNGIKLLISFFIEKKINYKIYCCESSQRFFEIINEPNTQSLWIFGHGTRGGIQCQDQYLPYSDLIKKMDYISRKKNYVYQFHCNAGGENSLADYLANGRGFANYKKNNAGGEIRGYIKNICSVEILI